MDCIDDGGFAGNRDGLAENEVGRSPFGDGDQCQAVPEFRDRRRGVVDGQPAGEGGGDIASPALLVRQNKEVEELGQPSSPLGVKATRSVDKFLGVFMNPGDSLVLYTDGIVECLNWEMQQYGFERWISFLSKTLPSLPIDDPLSFLLSDVEAHAAGRPRDDDVTLVVIRRRPAPPIN